MDTGWMYAPMNGLQMASLSLYSPRLPVQRKVPHHTLRLLRGVSGQTIVRFSQRAETVAVGAMLLLGQDAAYTAEASENGAMLCELDIAFRPMQGGLQLPCSLYRGDADYAALCDRYAEPLVFEDIFGLARCLLGLLEARAGHTGEPPPTVTALILAALLTAAGAAQRDPDGMPVLHSEHVKHTLAFIHAHYMEKIGVEDISTDAHLHPNYLHRLFTAEMGCSIGEYLTRFRMEKACALLIGSRLNVSDIARMCGMPNHQHFTKTFRRMQRISPTDFRLRYDITCNYAAARTQYGVTHYAAPALSEAAVTENLSLFDPIHKQRDFIPVVKAYYSRADMVASTKDTTDHAHSLYEIMYVHEGMITVEVENSAIAVGHGQYIWLDASVHHKLTLNPDMPSSVVNIEFACMESGLPVPGTRQLYETDAAYAAMLEHPVPWLRLSDSRGMIGTLLNQIVLLADSSHRKKDLLCSQLTQLCMLMIAAQRQQDGARCFQGDPLLERVAEQVDTLYAEPLTVDMLAEQCRVTPTRLQQMMRRATGQTVNAYIQSVRIQKACSLLRDGCTVLDAATRVGFSSQQYFSQLFKRLMGGTPTAYRADALAQERNHHGII